MCEHTQLKCCGQHIATFKLRLKTYIKITIKIDDMVQNKILQLKGHSNIVK